MLSKVLKKVFPLLYVSPLSFLLTYSRCSTSVFIIRYNAFWSSKGSFRNLELKYKLE